MEDQGAPGSSSAALARLRSARNRRGAQKSTPSYLQNSVPLSAVATTAPELAPATDGQTAAPEGLQVQPSAKSESEMPSLANFASLHSLRARSSTESLARQGSEGATAAADDRGKGEERASLTELGVALKRSLNGGVPRVSIGPEKRISGASSLASEGAAALAEAETPADEASEDVPAAVEILFVDDCRIQRKMVPRLLDPLGITVHTVASGEECIDWLEERFNTTGPASFPVVILQDLHMPTRMSGRDTAKAFRKKFPDLPTPIIAYTADDDESIIPGLLEDGFTDYVAKMPGCRGLKARLQVRVLYAPSPRLVKSFSSLKITKEDEIENAKGSTAAAAAAAVAANTAASSSAGASSSADTSPRPSAAAPSSREDPNSKAAASPSGSQSPSSAPSGSDPAPEDLPEVLLVDDDQIQRKVVPKVLSKIGVKVTAMESGDSAVMMLRARHKRKGPGSFPALIILDLHMPGMSGVETARALREKFPEIEIPIIAFTGDEDESIVPALMDAGFSDYVAKLPQCRGLRARIQVQLHLIETQKRTAALVGKDERLKDVLPTNVLNNIRHGSQAFESVSILFVFIHRFTELLDEYGDSRFAAVNTAAFDKLCSFADKRFLHCKEEERESQAAPSSTPLLSFPFLIFVRSSTICPPPPVSPPPLLLLLYFLPPAPFLHTSPIFPFSSALPIPLLVLCALSLPYSPVGLLPPLPSSLPPPPLLPLGLSLSLLYFPSSSTSCASPLPLSPLPPMLSLFLSLLCFASASFPTPQPLLLPFRLLLPPYSPTRPLTLSPLPPPPLAHSSSGVYCQSTSSLKTQRTKEISRH